MKGDWVDRPGVAIRVHKIPRQGLYIPSADGEDIPPVAITAIDVTRRTRTNLENADEKDIENLWCGDESDVRGLSDFWTGETVFDQRHTPPRLRHHLGTTDEEADNCSP